MSAPNYHAFVDELLKIAEEEPAVTQERPHPLATAARGIGGFALGAGAGYAGTHLADKAVKALGGSGLPPSVVRYGAPVLGAGAGLGFALLQHRMLEAMKEPKGPEGPGPHAVAGP